MQRRINIMLSDETIRLLERVTEKGDRSRLIEEAVRDYIRKAGRANLRKLLKEGAIRRAEQDRDIAETWFPLEEEAWQKPKK